MKPTLSFLAAAVVLTAGTARADVADTIAAGLTAQGYTRVELDIGSRYIEVEAIRGQDKLESVYDASTGALLRSRTEPVERDDSTAPGVFRDDDNDDDGDNALDDFDDDADGMDDDDRDDADDDADDDDADDDDADDDDDDDDDGDDDDDDDDGDDDDGDDDDDDRDDD